MKPSTIDKKKRLPQPGAAAGVLLLSLAATSARQKIMCALGCAWILSSCALIPNQVEQRASVFVGQSVDAAIGAFGQPSSRIPRNGDLDGSSGWQYVWNNTFEGADQRFVQTGTEHAGTSLVGVTPGGNGIAPMPIYQDHYRPTGYYENVLHGCMLFVETDRNDTVEEVSAFGDTC